MDKYNVFCRIVELTSITDSNERLKAISDRIFTEQATIDILNEMIKDEEIENYKLTLIDHLELLTQYQSEGISAFDCFVSFAQIEMSFVKFSYGFDSFEKRKNYLNSTLYLLDCKSIKYINRFIHHEKDLPDAYLIKYRLYRNLLKACRVIGINEAFDEFLPVDEKYLKVVNVLFRTESLYDLLSVVGQYSDEVSSKYIRNCFHYLQAQY